MPERDENNYDTFKAIVLYVAQYGKDVATYDKMQSQGFPKADLDNYHHEAVNLVDNTIQDGFKPNSYALIQEMNNRAPEYFKSLSFANEEEFFATPNNGATDEAARQLANKYVSVNIIDERTLLATIEVYPNTPMHDQRLASIYSHLSREEANILGDFSKDHENFYTTLMVVDKNQPLDKQVPRDINDISREIQRNMIVLDKAFFDKAFMHGDNTLVAIPADIRNTAEVICISNKIKGTSDPMYIANVIALELGRGDGMSHFAPTHSTIKEDIDRLAARINSAYSSTIIDPATTKDIISKYLSHSIMTPEQIKENCKYSVETYTGKETYRGGPPQGETKVVYGFYDKADITAFFDERRRKDNWSGYSISDNKELTVNKTNPYSDFPPGVDSIMTKLIKAGIKAEQMGNHCSDLYVEVNDISKAVIKTYEFQENVTTFKSNIDGKLNYEIPFAYQPDWDKHISAGPEPTAPGLPRMCYSKNDETGEAIILVRGKSGYNPAPYIADVEAQNKSLGVTKAQEEAMKVGSMFGWNVPGADPKAHTHLDPPPPPPVVRTPELERGTPDLGITRHNVGDKVEITLENMQVMINNSRSILANPSDIFVAKCRDIYEAKTEGIVTHTFPPGYEVTATFGKDTMHEQSLHMKDNYITNLTQKQSASLPDFPALSKYDKKELTDFIEVVTKNYPEAKIENITKLCTIASDMTKYNVQSANGTLSTERFNALTDKQEVQIKDIIKDMPGTKVQLDYEPRGAAIKLELPQGQTKGFGGGYYYVPEIPKNKLTIAPVPTKTATEIVSKKR